MAKIRVFYEINKMFNFRLEKEPMKERSVENTRDGAIRA